MECSENAREVLNFLNDIDSIIQEIYPSNYDQSVRSEIQNRRSRISALVHVFILSGERNSSKLSILKDMCGCSLFDTIHEKLKNAIIIIRHSDTSNVKIFHKNKKIQEFSSSKEHRRDSDDEISHIGDLVNKNIGKDMSLLQDYHTEISISLPTHMKKSVIIDVPGGGAMQGLQMLEEHLREKPTLFHPVNTTDRDSFERSIQTFQEFRKEFQKLFSTSTLSITVIACKEEGSIKEEKERSDISEIAIKEALPDIDDKAILQIGLQKEEEQHSSGPICTKVKMEIKDRENRDLKTHLEFMTAVCRNELRKLNSEDVPTNVKDIEKWSDELQSLSSTTDRLQVSEEDAESTVGELMKIVKDGDQLSTRSTLSESSEDSENICERERDDDQLSTRSRLSESSEDAENMCERERTSDLPRPSIQWDPSVPTRFADILIRMEKFEQSMECNEERYLEGQVVQEWTGISFDEGRRKLVEIYDEIENAISKNETDIDFQEELRATCPGYKKALEIRKKDLNRKDASIVIAGETNAGKTTLINKIIREDILQSYHLSNTNRICRIRNSDETGIQLLTKENKLIREKMFSRDNVDEFYSEIDKYTQKENADKPDEEKDEDIFFVDILFPIQILQGDVVIVDTPGLNEYSDIRQKLIDYLPNALSFVIVLNVSNDGGLQYDRLPRLLEKIKARKSEMPCFYPSETLFIANKWDAVHIQVPSRLTRNATPEKKKEFEENFKQKEVEKMKQGIIEKLKKIWPLGDTENIFHVSLIKEDGESAIEYERFKKRLSEMVQRNCNRRLKEHMVFLLEFAHNMDRSISGRLKMYSLSEENCLKMKDYVQYETDRLKKNAKKVESMLRKEIKLKKDKLVADLKKSMRQPAWKEKTLNPEGKVGILEVSISQLHQEIPNRVMCMIENWVANGECRDEIAKMETAMIEHFEKMQKQLTDIESNLMNVVGGDETTQGSGAKVGKVVGVVASSPLWIPLALLGGVLALVGFATIMSPYLIYKAFSASGMVQRSALIDMVYTQAIAKIDNKTLQEVVDHATEHVENQIKECFEVYIPRHADGIQRMLVTFSTKGMKLDEKKKTFMEINKNFSSVRIELATLRERFSL